MAFGDPLHVEADSWYGAGPPISVTIHKEGVSDLGRLRSGCTYSIVNSPPCGTMLARHIPHVSR